MKLLKSTILFSTLFLFHLQIMSQQNFQSIIESTTVKDKIKFKVINKNLEISIDGGIYKPIINNLSLQGKSKIIVFNSNFIHPLKYRISLENKFVDDELEKAAIEYLSQMSSTLLAINKTSASSSSSASFMASPVVGTKNIILLKNNHMIELFAFLNGITKDFFDNTKTTDLLNAMSAIKDSNKVSIINSYDKMYSNIWRISKYEDINNAIDNNKKIMLKVDSILTLMKTNLDNLKTETIKFNAINVSSPVTTLEVNTAALINLKRKKVEDDYSTFLMTKVELDEKYKKMEDLFKKIIDKSYLEKKEETRIDTVSFKKGKINEVTVYFKTYNYDEKTKSLTQKEEKKYKINIRKYRKLIPVVSSGVLYTNLSFNTYGTETNVIGQTILHQGNSIENEIAVGAYLNFYLNNGWHNPVFFQLGIGPSKEKPLLFGGLGINLASKLSLSAGAVFTWKPTLNKLSVGDVVSGTVEIENDIQYNFTSTPSFYLGITYNISSNKK